MKQIFDDLRENVIANSVEVISVEIIGKDRVLMLIDAAEAKWNDVWIPFTQREMDEEEREYCGTEEGFMLDCPLPEEDEEILVTYANGTVDVDTFMRDGNECYLDSGNELVTEAVAWMRKPEPYHGRESK